MAMSEQKFKLVITKDILVTPPRASYGVSIVSSAKFVSIIANLCLLLFQFREGAIADESCFCIELTLVLLNLFKET